MNWTFAIGDVHGCLEHLKRMVSDIEAQVTRSREKIISSKIIFLGDYIDRGPDSAGVVDFVRDRVDNHGDIALRGNHDQMMADAVLREMHVDTWIMNGGGKALQSYGIDLRDAEAMENVTKNPRIVADAEWLGSRPLFYEDELRFYVHAGIDPEKPLDQQDERDMLWIRSPFLNHPDAFPKHIVHGHTAHMGEPESWNGARTNLDTGAVFYGMMTAGAFNDQKPQAAGFLRVKL